MHLTTDQKVLGLNPNGVIKMYDIKSHVFSIDSNQALYDSLFAEQKYDYIYLATHGCETSWGNISGTVDISWLNFASMICGSYVAKEGTIVFHSCCRGGLNQSGGQPVWCGECGEDSFDNLVESKTLFDKQTSICGNTFLDMEERIRW